MRFPATPGWVSLPVVVGVPRHSWLRPPGAFPRHSWLGSAGGGGVRLPATPGSGVLVAVGCFAGGGIPCCVCLCCVWLCGLAMLCCVLRVCGCPRCRWCGVVVRGGCLPRALVCVVACVWFAGGPWLGVPASFGWGLRLVFVWLSLVCGVAPPPLLAEGCGCCAPPLLAGVRRCAVVVGPLPLLAAGLVFGAPPLLAGVHRRVPWLVPHHSWPRAVGVVPGHSWLGSTGCGGGGPWCPSLCSWCVCVCCVALRVGVGGVGGVVRGVAAVCVRVCVCGVWLAGCVIPWLVLAVGRHDRGQKAEEKQ